MTTAIIVAAGSSRRMGFDKLLARLAGKPVIAHSIAAFEQCREIGEIILVTRREQVNGMGRMVATGGFRKVKQIIVGGAERHLSVWNGLQAVRAGADYVAIHDGARPLVTPGLIRKCLALAKKEGAACLASLVADTLKLASASQLVTGSVDRAGLWAMQTPQIFARDLIFEAYAGVIAKGEHVTDEVSAVQKLKKQVALLRNDEWNFKITFSRDLEMAEHVIKARRGKQNAKQK